MTQIIPQEKRWHALSIGTLTGFAGVGLIDFLHALISFHLTDYEGFGTLIGFSAYYLVFGLPLAFMACFILGVPLYLIFNKTSEMNAKASIAMGVLMGSIFGLANFIFFFATWPLWISIPDFISTILVGAIAGYVSFHFTKRPQVNSEKDSTQQTVLRGSE